MKMWMILLTALSMSLAWRIRGQFGHEIGAAMAGMLGAVAVVLLSGREDWHRRVHHFALFGALGWAFGGSISYMKVIGYCHSSDSATVLYGFAGVFLIGFLWSSLGGFGTALPAVLDADRLTTLFPAIGVVFAGWFVQDAVSDVLRRIKGFSLNWFDSDWLNAATALLVLIVYAAVRRRIDFGTSLLLHLAIGWWGVFLALVVALDLHLNPPRGDNWAGVVGLATGALVFCHRKKLTVATRVALVTGFAGATGFVLGQALKSAFIATGVKWGWHAMMEWGHGLFFGVALAVAMIPLVSRLPEVDQPRTRYVTVFSLLFVLWAIPYLNFLKSPALWLREVKTLPGFVYGLPVAAGFAPTRGFVGWFELLFIGLGVLMAWQLIRPSEALARLLPSSWFGRGLLLYLVFLWIITVISGAHEIPGLEPIGFVIQAAITLHAVLCTGLILASKPLVSQPAAGAVSTRRIIAIGLMAAVLAPLAGWGVKRALYGDSFSGYFYMDHIRFGPNNTNNTR